MSTVNLDEFNKTVAKHCPVWNHLFYIYISYIMKSDIELY